MKAPDKIYIGLEDVGSRHRVYNVSVIPNGYDEYIRKDALLEWAKEMKRICQGAEPIEKAYQTMIDKIESL